MKKSSSPEQNEELDKIRKKFRSLEKSMSTWFYPMCFKIEGYGFGSVNMFIEEYVKKGFEFKREFHRSYDYPKRGFFLPGKDYYKHRNDKVAYLVITKTMEVGVWPHELEERKERGKMVRRVEIIEKCIKEELLKDTWKRN